MAQDVPRNAIQLPPRASSRYSGDCSMDVGYTGSVNTPTSTPNTFLEEQKNTHSPTVYLHQKNEYSPALSETRISKVPIA